MTILNALHRSHLAQGQCETFYVFFPAEAPPSQAISPEWSEAQHAPRWAPDYDHQTSSREHRDPLVQLLKKGCQVMLRSRAQLTWTPFLLWPQLRHSLEVNQPANKYCPSSDGPYSQASSWLALSQSFCFRSVDTVQIQYFKGLSPWCAIQVLHCQAGRLGPRESDSLENKVLIGRSRARRGCLASDSSIPSLGPRD
ncbi:hypothetical protein NPIL_597931 [Nephila pilipes]|uniref:Uncharacterized protein n=1 Tax=Nephila pilipes TaxID=299642 RepID=A0A8X6PBF1_NEPPI|nr:hypothetical protein NPIL_597931 [Nephila pilipes]